MGNETASRILMSTSKSLENIGNQLLDYSMKKQELEEQRGLVELQKIGRMQDLMKTASPTARKAIGLRLVPMVSKATGVQLPEDAFNQGLPELLDATRIYLAQESDSDEERSSLGNVSDYTTVVFGDDRKGALQYVQAIQGKKKMIQKYFGGGSVDEAVGESESWGQAKELGMKPSLSESVPGVPGGGGTEGRLSFKAPPVSEESDSRVIEAMGKYMDRLVENWQNNNRNKLLPNSVRNSFRQMTREYGADLRAVMQEGNPAGTQTGAPAVAPSTAPRGVSREPLPTPGGVDGGVPAVGELPYGTTGKGEPLSPKQAERITSVMSVLDEMPSYTEDVLSLFEMRPDETGPTAGRVTAAATRDDFWGWLATGAKAAITKTALPSPIAKKVTTQQGYLGKMFAQIAEGSGRLSDTDFSVGKKMVPDFLGDPGTAYAQFLGTMQIASSELRAQKQTAVAQGAPPDQIALFDAAITKSDGMVKGADALVKAMSVPLKVKDEVVSELVEAIYPALKRADEVGAIEGARTPEDLEAALLRYAPKGSKLILSTLVGMKDKNGIKGVRDQIFSKLLEKYQSEAGGGE